MSEAPQRPLPRVRRVLVALALAGATFAPLAAQQRPPTQSDLDASRRRLDSIKAERNDLERQQMRIQGQVTDVNARLRNLERQRDATNAIVNEIERQIGNLGSQLSSSSQALALAEDNLADRKAILRRRLVDIYKRGPLYTFQVLLSAESFGDLLARYKYLYLTSRQDRTLVTEVEKLASRVRAERNDLLGIQSELDQRKGQRETELKRYAQLAEERQTQLRELQRSSAQNKQQITALERAETQMTATLAALDKARRAAEANRPPSAGEAGSNAGGLTTDEIGKLDWPVDGRIIFQFGRDTLKSGAVVRHNGIGIAAALGTPVKAVESGKVALAQPMSTYGLTIILQHGNGFYSLYTQLKRSNVKVGQSVTRGDVIGTVGGENTDEGPHLYFELRGDNQIALDPIVWLKRRE